SSYYIPDVRSVIVGGGDHAAVAQRGDDDGERRGLPRPGHRADRPGRGAGGDPHDSARGHGERARHGARRPDLHAGGHRVRVRLQQLRAGDRGRVGRDRVRGARPRRGRAGGRGGAADQVRPVGGLRRDRAPGPRCDRGVPGPQSSARAGLVSSPAVLPAGRRRGRPGYDLASVLAVAVELFNERGYDGTSMRDLAARLGIAKSAIYHHVAGKEELLRLALDRALGGLATVTTRARALPAPAIERLEYLVRGSVEVLEAESPYVTLLLRVRGNTDVERAALDKRRTFDRFVAELVAEAVRDGDIRSDADAMLTARLLFGLVNSIVEWYRPDRRPKTVPLADAVCALAFDGLRPRLRGTTAQ